MTKSCTNLGVVSYDNNGIIYTIGGASKVQQPLHTIEAYDPVTNTWTQKSDMQTARFFLSSGFDVLSVVEEYDPASDMWNGKTSLTEPRVVSSCATNGEIYAIGGVLTIKPPHPAVSTVEVYIP